MRVHIYLAAAAAAVVDLIEGAAELGVWIEATLAPFRLDVDVVGVEDGLDPPLEGLTEVVSGWRLVVVEVFGDDDSVGVLVIG